jgi:hypothetical protein
MMKTIKLTSTEQDVLAELLNNEIRGTTGYQAQDVYRREDLKGILKKVV